MFRRRLLFCCLWLGACAPLVPPPPGAGVRELSGMLAGTTTLAGEVVLTGDVVVLPGAELTIAAGTTLRVRRAESTKIDPEHLSSLTELLVHGTLRVEGRPDAPVRFLPEQPLPAGEIAWGGVVFDRGAAGSVKHARIEQAEQGVLCIGAAPELVGNEIVACRYGIVVQDAAPRILDNLVAQGEGGVFCWNGARPYLQGNRIVANEEEGIFVDAASRPWLDRNQVSGNAIGLALGPRDLPYDPSGIVGNREDLRLLGGTP